MLDLKQNYFELFAQPVQFTIDQTAVTEGYRVLQKTLHPDNFAAGSAQEKRLSMQAASYVNEAYQTLNHDLRRLTYLLSLQGIDIDSETDTSVDPLFLMAQMEYREQLEDIPVDEHGFDAIDALRKKLHSDVDELISVVTSQLEKEDFSGARESARKWQFLEKLTLELGELEHRIDDLLDQ